MNVDAAVLKEESLVQENILNFPERIFSGTAHSVSQAIAALTQKVNDVERYNLVVRQVAHDIQSPLSSLKIAVNHIQSADDRTKKIIMDSIERIQSISAELTCTSQTSNCSGCHISDIVRTMIYQKTFEFMNLKVTYKFNPAEDIKMKNIDKDTFSRMLSNLINNSIESFHGSDGTIEIDIKDFKNYFVVSVKDNGVGIPAEICENVGTRGFTFGKEKGQGLGLSFVKEKVESMGGQLHVISKLDKGTLIQMVIPN